MQRDVDLAKLQALPGRKVQHIAAGATVINQGDDPGDLYVTITGRVRLERDGAAIAELGPGSLFGEVALLGGVPQPYAAIADDKSITTLIAVPADAVLKAIGAGGKIATGLAQTLADRAHQLAALSVLAGPPPTEEAAPPAAGGLPSLFGPSVPAPPPSAAPPSFELPLPPWEAAKQAAATGGTAAPRVEAFWTKQMHCVLCEGRFAMQQIRDAAVEVASRESDLHEIHRGPNPLHYQVAVCPSCFYASYLEDFDRVFAAEKTNIERALADVRLKIAHVDLRGQRDERQARMSFELALVCYGQRRAPAHKLAGLYHRLAWLAREAGDAAQERGYLTYARGGYVASIEKGEATSPRQDITITYLIADLSKRIGDYAEASKWVGQTMAHSQYASAKAVAERAQALREELRALKAID
jgi:uncharacterized protein (DUF2225 family)